MALFWSLDRSLIYFFLGAALFAFFMSLYHYPKTPVPDFFSKQKGKAPYKTSRPSETISDIFENIFAGKSQGNSGAPPRPAMDQRSKSFILGVVIFIFSIFLIIIISVLASDDNYSLDSIESFQRAEQFRWNGETDSAEFYYRKTLAADPEYLQALIGFGNTWIAKERYDSAHRYFDKALEVDSQSDEARYGKALTFHYQKNYRRSLQECFDLIEEDPEYSDATLLAGDNYYVQQRYDSALYWYEDGYDRGVRNAGLCHVMGYIYDTKGQQEKAVQLYKETLSLDSTRVLVYDRLAELVPGESEFYKAQSQKLRDAGYGN